MAKAKKKVKAEVLSWHWHECGRCHGKGKRGRSVCPVCHGRCGWNVKIFASPPALPKPPPSTKIYDGVEAFRRMQTRFAD